MTGVLTCALPICESSDIFDKTVKLINDFKIYFTENKQPIYENPSPGNKAGGISTLEEKSLGCTQKAGNTIVRDVLNYGDRIKKPGLNLLNAPGNDLVASTALAVSGCQLVLFTTGRGNPFGSPVPTVKISSNSNLYSCKKNWIDFNAGQILEGKSFENVTDEFCRYLLAVASGKEHTKNEVMGYKEIFVFRDGVIL